MQRHERLCPQLRIDPRARPSKDQLQQPRGRPRPGGRSRRCLTLLALLHRAPPLGPPLWPRPLFLLLLCLLLPVLPLLCPCTEAGVAGVDVRLGLAW